LISTLNWVRRNTRDTTHCLRNMSLEEHLECGSSLAEREHGGEDMPPPARRARAAALRGSDEAADHAHDAAAAVTRSHSSTLSSITTASKRTSVMGGPEEGLVNGNRCESSDQQAPSDDPMPIQSLSSLRSALGHDVIAPESFASPFERRCHHKSNSSSNHSGKNEPYQVPLVYCDQTASNRPLESVERYVRTVCLPLYGNTHTNTCVAGSQSTAFVAEARQLVAEMCNAKVTGKASLDAVLFAYVTGCAPLAPVALVQIFLLTLPSHFFLFYLMMSQRPRNDVGRRAAH
jgi:hypothetical protein